MIENKDNIICDTDSYKASQPEQYQEGTEAYFGYISARLAPRSVEPISETVFSSIHGLARFGSARFGPVCLDPV